MPAASRAAPMRTSGSDSAGAATRTARELIQIRGDPWPLRRHEVDRDRHHLLDGEVAVVHGLLDDRQKVVRPYEPGEIERGPGATRDPEAVGSVHDVLISDRCRSIGRNPCCVDRLASRWRRGRARASPAAVAGSRQMRPAVGPAMAAYGRPRQTAAHRLSSSIGQLGDRYTPRRKPTIDPTLLGPIDLIGAHERSQLRRCGHAVLLSEQSMHSLR